MFLKNKNIIFKIRRSKVTDYAAIRHILRIYDVDIDSNTSSPSGDRRKNVVSYKRNYVHEVLVNRLLTFAREKVWLCELTVLT